MKVIATAKGYFGRVREEGDEFDVPDDIGKSSWFTPVDAPKPAKHDAKAKGKAGADEGDPI